MNTSRENTNLQRIEELYAELNRCFSDSGCDHTKATSILNSIIERKKFLKVAPKVSRYVDFKQMIFHYVKSADQKECHYDEINVPQIEKKIQEFTSEQALHLYEVFKRELLKAGYTDKVEDLNIGINLTKLKFYAKQKGFKARLNWLSVRCSYRTRYLVYMLTGSFIFFNLILLPAKTVALFKFTTLNISNVKFFNHVGNTMIYVFGLNDEVKVEPLNFMGVLLMIIGKTVFVLFIVNFLLKKILDKIIR